MSASRESLESLRRDIDAIDDQMHDLLMRRAEIVLRVGALKSDSGADVYIRTAREAQILRRLAQRHSGRFPFAVVVRMWREMLAATSGLQGDFSVAMSAPEPSPASWDLVRDHFGSYAPMTYERSPNRVIEAVRNRSATVGVLPLPTDGEAGAWWPLLVSAGEARPRIVARLPFANFGAVRPERPAGLAIAMTEPGESGDDVTLVAVEVKAEVSRSTVRQAFVDAGLAATDIVVWSDDPNAATRLHLVELAEYAAADDPRLATVVTDGRFERCVSLGGYAVSLSGAGHDE